MSSRRYDGSASQDDARELEDMMLAVRARKEGNQYCADCGVPSPEYVNLTIGTFICEVCADIHRSTSKRQVKDIFAGILSLADIRRMETVGNEVANRRFLATWNPDEIPQPDRSNRQLLKEFLWLKYDGSFKKPAAPIPPPPQPAPRRALTEGKASSMGSSFPQSTPAAGRGAQQGQLQQNYWASRFAPPPRPQPAEHASNSMDEYFSQRASNTSWDSAYRSTMPGHSDRFQPPLHHSRSAYTHQPPNPPPLPPPSRRPMYAPHPPPPSHLPHEYVDYDYRHPQPQQSPYPYPGEDPYGPRPPYAPASPHYDPYERSEHDPRHDRSPRRTKQKSKKKGKNNSDDWENDHDRNGKHGDEDDYDDDTASGSASSRRGRKLSSTAKKSSKKKTKESVSKSAKSTSTRESKDSKSKRRSAKYDDDSDETESDDEIVQTKKKSSKKKTSNTSDHDADSVRSTDGLDPSGDSRKASDVTQNKNEFDLMSEWMGDSKETDGSTGLPPTAGTAGLNGAPLPNMVPPQGMQMPNAYQTAAHMPMMPLNMYHTVVPGLMPPFPAQGSPFLPGMSMHPNMAPLPGLMAGMHNLAINPAAPPPNFAVPPPPPIQNQQQIGQPPPPPLGMPAGPPPGPPPGGPPNE